MYCIECIVPAGSTYFNDQSFNVAYFITCNKCKLHYVGETSQNLNERFTWHNTHFSKGYSKELSYTVNIIKKPERTEPIIFIYCQYYQKSLKEPNLQIEILWILQLNQFKRLEKSIGFMNYEQFFRILNS